MSLLKKVYKEELIALVTCSNALGSLMGQKMLTTITCICKDQNLYHICRFLSYLQKFFSCPCSNLFTLRLITIHLATTQVKDLQCITSNAEKLVQCHNR